MDAAMEVLLDAGQMDRILHDLASEIAAKTPPQHELAIIGIRSRGEILAQRLATCLSQQLGKPVPCGTLDITLYRDDLNAPHGGGQPQVRTTEAVLVERAGRELPIQADYAGCAADVEPQLSVQVNLVESDGEDGVIVE
jgi:pyrimidine operon attenuation protein/uracil phosphoribosyltransferase